MRFAGWVAAAVAVSACGQAGTVAPVDAGSGSVGHDGGADAGAPDGGPTASDCTGIVPASTGAALSFDVPEQAGKTCAFATSDGRGIVAVESHDAGTTPAPDDGVRWFELSANGTYQNDSFPGPSALFPQPVGFQGYTTSWVALWTESGLANFSPVESGATVGPAFANSGTVALGSNGGLTLHRIDVAGNESGSASAQAAGTPLAVAEDQGGQILAVVQSGGAAKGLWFDLAHGAAGTPFDLGAVSHEAIARGLVGGGVAVRLDGRWTAVVQPGSSAPAAPPDWMNTQGARTRTLPDFALVRGGKAYAVSEAGRSSIDLVSTGGNACGTVAFSGVASLTVGADGTVVGSSGANGCGKVFWRGALR
jgi:hypothetical protein